MLAVCVIAVAMTILNLYVTIQGFMNPDMPPRLFGYSSLLASDGSMEGKQDGSFDKGSMILFKSSEDELQVGEVVAYSVKGGFIIGRITSVNDDGDGRYYRVKGDNIEGEYLEVMTESSYIGSYSAEFPFLGALTRFMGTTAGQIIFVWIPGAIGAFCLIWEIWLTIFGIAKAIDERKEDEDEESEEKRKRIKREPIELFGWVGAALDWLGGLFSRREKPVKAAYGAPVAVSKAEEPAETAPETKTTPEIKAAPEEPAIKEIHKAPEVTSLSGVDIPEDKSETETDATLLRIVTVTETVKEAVIDPVSVTELAAVLSAETPEAAVEETAVTEEPEKKTAVIIEAPLAAEAATDETTVAEIAEVAEEEPAVAVEAVAEESAEAVATVAEIAEVAEEEAAVAVEAVKVIEMPAAATADGEDDDDELSFTYTENGVKLFSKLRKSYMARLIQSSDELKGYYNEVKRELLSYKGVKGRASWGCETFKKTKVHLARVNVKVKTLCLYLALDYEEFKDSKYFPTDESALAKFASTPMMVKIKSERGVKYAKELIAILAERYGLERLPEPVAEDFRPPYETTVALIERGLIKDLSGTYAKVSAAEADTLMTDSHAEKLIVEETVPEVISDRTRRGIVNVDTLSDSFESGEEVTLSEMKARIRGFDRRMTYVKVLARGTLSKSLTVHADEFSIQAAKMILLTGGKIIRTKKK